MPGAANYNQDPSIEKLHSAMRALAQFHVALSNFTAPPTAPGSTRLSSSQAAGGLSAVQRHLSRLQELTPARINDLSSAIRDWTWPDLAPLAHQFVAQLPRAVQHAIANLEPLANVPLPVQPCIRDIWHDHIFFTGDAVTGIVDFGAVDIDTPATDIARLLGSLAPEAPLPFRKGPGEGSLPANDANTVWTEGLAAYQTAKPLSSQEIDSARALNISGTILAGCNWIRWIYIDGREFANQSQVIDRFRRISTATSKYGQLRLN
jgi:homoserine kinase type II